MKEKKRAGERQGIGRKRMVFSLMAGMAGLVCLLGAANGYAQTAPKTRVPQQLYWTRYYNQLELSPRWEVHTELDNRRFMSPSRQHQAVFRTHLHYKFGDGWDVGAGFVRFYQFPHDPKAVQRLVVPEWRFFAEINQRTSIGKVQIRQRHRLEDRYFQRVDNGALAAGYRSNFRFRYQLQAEYPLLVQQGRKQGNLTLKASDEVMFNFGRQITLNYFDQNRLYLALNYQLLENVATEVGYLHWFQQQAVGNVYFDRDIVRLTVLHRVRLRKEQ